MKNKPTITLRKATIHDLATLRYWDEQAHVIASDPNDDWQWEYELTLDPEWREQLIAELDGQLLGFVQIIDPAAEETHYWGNIGENKRAIDIWIGDKENLGKGYGTQMMHLALERCFADENVTEVIIDPLASNTDAIRFYQRIGFLFVEHRTFGDDHCDVYAITRQQWRDKQPEQRHGKK